MRAISRAAWIAGLASGTLRIDVASGAFGRFGEDWRHRRRTLGVHICYGVAEGAIRVGLDAGDHLAGPGSLFWLSAGVTHSLELPPGHRQVSAWHARLETRDAQGEPVRVADDCLIARSPELLRTVGDLLHEARGEGRWAAERTQATAVLFFTRLIEAASTRPGGFDGDQEAAITRAVARHGQRLRPRDLAAAVGLAPAYFARRFTAHFGCPPRRWIVRQRLHRAAALLLERPGADIAAIAADCGFSDAAPFSRLFHREMGCTPTAFRTRRG